MYKKIVAGTDGSETAQEAVRQAAALAQLCGAKLHIASAYPNVTSTSAMAAEAMSYGMMDPKWEKELVEEIRSMLEKTKTTLFEQGLDVETHALAGDPADAILDLAENIGADVIVIGSKGMTGAKRFLLGSVPNKVAHHARCNVMIVHTA